MEHAPIYRSSKRLMRSSRIPWQRTASLASAAAGIALGGIALGYHGFELANDTLQGAQSASRVATLAFPAFSVQSTDGGHPDALGALSSALLARTQLSLAQTAGPVPFPLPQPPGEPVASVPGVDLPFIGPPELTFALVPAPPEAATAGVQDVPAEEPLARAADVPTPARIVAAPLMPVGQPQPEVVAASLPVAGDAAQVDEPPQDTGSPPVGNGAVAPVSQPAQTSVSTKPAPTKPKPTPVALPPAPRIVPVEDEQPRVVEAARDTPAEERADTPPPVHALPPRAEPVPAPKADAAPPPKAEPVHGNANPSDDKPANTKPKATPEPKHAAKAGG